MAKFLYSRAHHKPNDKHALIIILCSALVFIFLAAYIYNYMTFSARDRVVKQYMRGISEERPFLINELVAREYDGEQAVEKDIKELGGTRFITRTDYRANTTDGLRVDTTLYGFKDFKIIKKDISLIGMNEAWYLVIGALKKEFREN